VTTAIQRRAFVIQQLRLTPFDAEMEMFLAKRHGIMDVEVVTFPPEPRFGLPQYDDNMDFYDDRKCTFHFFIPSFLFINKQYFNWLDTYLKTDPIIAEWLLTESHGTGYRTHIPANLNGDGDFSFQLDCMYPESLMNLLTSDDHNYEKTREPLVNLLFAMFTFKA